MLRQFKSFAISIFFLILIVDVTSTCASAAEIAFFYAIDEDWKALQKEAGGKATTINVGGRTVHTLRASKHRIRAVKMGSGAVETAVSAQALLARHQCDVAVSVGPIGALDHSFKVGELVRIERIIAHQRGSWKDGQFAQSEKARWQLELPERFPADDWINSLKKITVASGEIFVADSGFKSELRARTGADAVDMNLFGLQTALDAHGVAAIHLRVVSDRADETASEDFAKFTSDYDGALGTHVARWLKSLPADPGDPQNYPELKKLLE